MIILDSSAGRWNSEKKRSLGRLPGHKKICCKNRPRHERILIETSWHITDFKKNNTRNFYKTCKLNLRKYVLLSLPLKFLRQSYRNDKDNCQLLTNCLNLFSIVSSGSSCKSTSELQLLLFLLYVINNTSFFFILIHYIILKLHVNTHPLVEKIKKSLYGTMHFLVPATQYQPCCANLR